MWNRIVEPSTHTALSVCILAVAMLLEVSTIESVSMTKWLIGWGGFHALLGVVLKEGR